MGTRIVILGPPGAGKGTVARIVSRIYGIPHITTGDMLRGAVAEGTERGRVAKEYMERGELVPDEVVNAIVEERLMEDDCDGGFILDGFPRNLRQAEALDRILGRKGRHLTHALNLVLDAEAIVGRLSLRRTCPRCGAVYHLRNNPPKEDEVCDEDGAELVQRSDDREEIIRHRLRVYEEETRPLLERYRGAWLVRDMRGDLPIAGISDEVRRILGR
ncbi:adenylate kinase [miscellaneous Crenarchaeota group-15 archaeon DG-45]|uniref:Adenylate kinase n=1 Tax=miscellaneous Crenarchaeota group-15 archaeon DG-45 TaxID=1685127 RepID=A0A0M0BQN9_9ARCH|nr:MAG: adenylate kinase [miscellaneous Crenarchaeota group-15 archaeon DG-45]